jgi:hypothetical protein
MVSDTRFKIKRKPGPKPRIEKDETLVPRKYIKSGNFIGKFNKTQRLSQIADSKATDQARRQPAAAQVPQRSGDSQSSQLDTQEHRKRPYHKSGLYKKNHTAANTAQESSQRLLVPLPSHSAASSQAAHQSSEKSSEVAHLSTSQPGACGDQQSSSAESNDYSMVASSNLTINSNFCDHGKSAPPPPPHVDGASSSASLLAGDDGTGAVASGAHTNSDNSTLTGPAPADSRSCSPDGGSLLQSSLRALPPPAISQQRVLSSSTTTTTIPPFNHGDPVSSASGAAPAFGYPNSAVPASSNNISNGLFGSAIKRLKPSDDEYHG